MRGALTSDSGTGLFLYTGAALQEGGPLGILLAFSIMGSVTYAVMISLGEMVSASPLPGGAISLAARFVDESLSFTLGWFYWYTWTIFLPSELSAIAVLINLWNTSVNNAVWISIFLVAAVSINMMGSAWYGETEFWLSYVKIFLIVGLIIVDIVISAGGVKGAPAIGFKYWRNPGPFVEAPGVSGALGRFLGFWSTLTRAAFSYIGSEIVAIAAGETQNPRKNVPKAIRNVYIRILLFYILGVFVIGITVPSDDPRLGLNSGTALASPFVIAIQTAGIKVLPTIVNAALLASGLSAANSELFTSSRALHGLALNGHAPKIFGHTNRRGVPYVAILSCAVFGALAYMSIKSSAGTAFGYLATLGSAGGLLMWWGVSTVPRSLAALAHTPGLHHPHPLREGPAPTARPAVRPAVHERIDPARRSGEVRRGVDRHHPFVRSRRHRCLPHCVLTCPASPATTSSSKAHGTHRPSSRRTSPSCSFPSCTAGTSSGRGARSCGTRTWCSTCTRT